MLDEVLEQSAVAQAARELFCARVDRCELRDGERLFHEIAPRGAFAAAIDARRNPATSIPVVLEDAPVSIGVLLVGHRGDDATVRSLARSVMRATHAPLARRPAR